jgi:hypothetical protein
VRRADVLSLPRRSRAAAKAGAVCGVLWLWFVAAVPASAQPHLAIIVGHPGYPEYRELYGTWAADLVDAATERFGVPRENVQYLTDRPDDDATRTTGRSVREEVVKAFEKLKAAGPDDLVLIVLIGHGTFDGREAKFNLPGPDMSPADFAPLVRRLPSQRVVFVNTASASGPFIEALSGPGRTVITATRSGRESFATIFGGFFINALISDEADLDKNGRVSFLEAFDYARREVEATYERQGIMLTEHALLEDSGGREGTAAPAADGKIGRTAALLSLGSPASDALPADPALRELYEERRALERRVESLRLMKDGMEPQRYSRELERVLTELALKTRQIREKESGGQAP